MCSITANAQDYQYEAYEFKCCTPEDGWTGSYPSNAMIFINIDKKKIYSNILPETLKLVISNVKKEYIRNQNVTRIEAYNLRNKNDVWHIRHCVHPNGKIQIYFDHNDVTLLYNVKQKQWTVEW